MGKIIHFGFGAAIVCLIVLACAKETEHPVANKILELSSTQKSYQCTLDSLHATAQALWDEVTDTLSIKLPPDMPAEEKKNMLAVRNTSLIQMFMVYDSLDNNVQQLVEMAGLKDLSLSNAMKEVQMQLHSTSHSLDSLLMVLEKEDPKLHKSVQASILATIGQPCR